MKESDVQRSILDWLAVKRITAWRMNTGAMVSEYQGRKRFMRFGSPGMADILASPETLCGDGQWRPHFLWIECKAPKGKQSDDQRTFQEAVTSIGHIYVLAYSIDDVEEAVRAI